MPRPSEHIDPKAEFVRDHRSVPSTFEKDRPVALGLEPGQRSTPCRSRWHFARRFLYTTLVQLIENLDSLHKGIENVPEERFRIYLTIDRSTVLKVLRIVPRLTVNMTS